ncbi:MAG: threonine synthase [Deltaproteobacteria bacterium]|nr:threonine synthase [Deltaproteobacteria bacterium]
MSAILRCVTCNASHPLWEVRYTCTCGGLLDVVHDPATLATTGPFHFDARLTSRRRLDRSGVWRFREAVVDLDAHDVVSLPEGGTRVYAHPRLNAYAGVDDVVFKHEGDNPTASFKDRGMTVATSVARRVGARAVACASTGNTSASLAAYAAQAGMRAFVLVPAGKISVSKLAQTLAYGARVLRVAGDFDAAMALVRQASEALGVYLLNSINPFRIQGQKTIAWELLQDLVWDPPDWVVLPAGNLGNTSAIGQALLEAHRAGWIRRVPRLASVQAAGANPFYRSFREGFATRHRVVAETVASAIRIGDPVSHDKARRVIQELRGVVTEVPDEEILRAKRALDGAGIGCEPASACSLAGTRRLVADGVIRPHERVACILTGHVLKDPDAVTLPVPGEPTRDSQVVDVDATLDGVKAAFERT